MTSTDNNQQSSAVLSQRHDAQDWLSQLSNASQPDVEQSSAGMGALKKSTSSEQLRQSLASTPTQNQHYFKCGSKAIRKSKERAGDFKDWTGMGLYPIVTHPQIPPGDDGSAFYLTPTSEPNPELHLRVIQDDVDMDDSRNNRQESSFSVKTETFYDRIRDPRRSEPSTPKLPPELDSNVPSPPDTPCPRRTLQSVEIPSSTQSHIINLSDSDESLSDEEDEYEGSFDPMDIDIPDDYRTIRLSRYRRGHKPLLLYRSWSSQSGGSNSPYEFRPGILVDGVAPREDQWNSEFLDHAAGHLNREMIKTPLVSFTETFLLAFQKSLQAVDEGAEPYITIINPNTVMNGFIHAAPICEAIKSRDLGDSRVKKYFGAKEWLHWGTLRATNTYTNPFLGTASIKHIISVANEDSAIRDILRFEALREGGSVRKILKKFARDPLVCNERIASGLGRLARLFRFTSGSEPRLLRHFIFQVSEGFALAPCSPDAQHAVANSFAKAFANFESIRYEFTMGNKEGYKSLNSWVAWDSQRLKRKPARLHSAPRDYDGFSNELPWEEQAYRGRRTRDETATVRITRGQASTMRKENSQRKTPNSRSRSRGRNGGRGTYHEGKLVRSRSLGGSSRERKRKRDHVKEEEEGREEDGERGKGGGSWEDAIMVVD
ncbi:MAG: hypothetical protein M1820_009992 [Bogoriella megaspora]|nr:MAG: hypothetical protein M1820_009992 [Bogoriella megaspora]